MHWMIVQGIYTKGREDMGREHFRILPTPLVIVTSITWFSWCLLDFSTVVICFSIYNLKIYFGRHFELCKYCFSSNFSYTNFNSYQWNCPFSIYLFTCLIHYRFMDIYFIQGVIIHYYHYFVQIVAALVIGSSFSLPSVPFWHAPSFFEHFFTFWHYKML